jgi:SAM-dependent methyltransferase
MRKSNGFAPRGALGQLWDRYWTLPLTRFVEDIVLRRQVERLYLVFGGHIFFQTLRTAVQLDLFTLLAKEGELTREEIAKRLGVADQPARIVVLGLTVVGLLRKRGTHYSNSHLAGILFVKDSPRKITSYVELQHRAMYKGLYWMLDAVREYRNVGIKEFAGNEPTLYERLAHDPEVEQIFQEAMQELSVQANADLTRFADLSGVKHLVDVGGGDGTNVIALARRWGQLRATVFDSPTVCEIARKNIAASGLGDRLDAVAGECFSDPFPKDADCLMFAHFFTIWGEKKDRELLKKCYESLPAGGKVLIFNMMQHDNETGPLSAAVGSPYFLTLATGLGMLYTWREYESWMRDAGFRAVERYKLLRDHGLIIGTKR